jgi:ribA/ribD-fused uncharacterized protein
VEYINEFTGVNRFLSNFWSCFIIAEGTWYPSVENAYQAMKMSNKLDRLRFVTIKASEAKKLGRTLPMRPDWDDVKLEVMYQLVKQKFADPMLGSHLLNTGDAELQEGNYWGDTYWGTVNGFGENHLGKILMRVREELKEAERMKDVMLS